MLNINSLGLKLTLLLAFILSLILFIFSYSAIKIWESSYINAEIYNSERFSDTLKRSTQYSMMKNQNEALHEIINAVGKQKGIEWVRIFNKEGKIMYSTATKEIGVVLDRKAESCYQCHSDGKPIDKIATKNKSRIIKSKNDVYRILATIDPIYNSESCYTSACHVHPKEQKVLGVLDIAVSLENMDQTLKSRTYSMILFGLLSIFFVCISVAVFVRKYVGSPVKNLLAGTQKITDGELSHVIPVKENDEIGRLATSFNIMTKSLEKAHNDLEGWAKELEKRVEEKTIELKEANLQVIRAEKLASLGRMAAGVAHELNNPLTGILTFAHLVNKTVPENSQQKSDLEVIIGEANRCSKIIKDLLDFARESKTDKKPFSVNELIKQTVAISEHQSLFHNIKTILTLDENIPLTIVDAAQIKQVLVNIIFNAAEAMTREGILTISTGLTKDPSGVANLQENPSGYIEIKIADTGCGIPKENIGKIFDPFFTTKDPGRGTGLGLSVSLKLIENHGGTIKVTSERDRGTVFSVFLPVSDMNKK